MLTTLVLVIHAIIAVALVGVILLQRSEGGGLGIGGGGGGGLMTARGAADLLTRTTTWLAAAFIGTSILLAVLAAHNAKPRDIDTSLAKSAPAEAPTSTPAPAGTPPLLPGLPGTAAPATQPPADSVPIAQ